MIKHDELSSIWKTQVQRGWKHMDYTIAVEKNCKFLNECLEKIDVDNIHEVLDWGPGGGWLSQFFPDRMIHLVDIVQSNLEESSKNILSAAKSVETYCVQNSDSIKSLSLISPDILLAFSVIYHFPTMKYWKEVSDVWKEMSPWYITGRTFLTDGGSWERPTGEYSIGANYLRGIVLNKFKFLETFPDYDLIYEKRIDKDYQTHGAPSDQYSYVFVLERKRGFFADTWFHEDTKDLTLCREVLESVKGIYHDM